VRVGSTSQESYLLQEVEGGVVYLDVLVARLATERSAERRSQLQQRAAAAAEWVLVRPLRPLLSV
jgi:hypothetical protein